MQVVETTIIRGMAFAMPLFIMALGSLFCERSGVTNLAIEGFMGFGAFVGAIMAAVTANGMGSSSQFPMVVGFVCAAIGGGLFAIIHAVLCVKFKADQVISGVVVNMLSMALVLYLLPIVIKGILGKNEAAILLTPVTLITIPGLSKIPVLGAFFKDIYPSTILIILLAVVFWFYLYKKRGGMRLRACGEFPQALDAVGINVYRVRYKAVIVSGMLSGLGGMALCYVLSLRFSGALFMGYGYLAIAATIFGNWKLLPTLGASVFFGLAMALGDGIKAGSAVPIPVEFLSMLPYLLTLLALVVFSKKNAAPRALGEVYDKSKR